LEHILFHRNRTHFAQADGTPFTRPPVSSALHFIGVNQAGEDILNCIGLPEGSPDSAVANSKIAKKITTISTSSHQIKCNDSGLCEWVGVHNNFTLVQHFQYATNKDNQQNISRPTKPHISLIVRFFIK
jgi:hypothetical protein